MMRHAIKNDVITKVDNKEVDYELPSTNQFFGSHLNLIPLQSSVHGSRLFYGSKYFNQALPLSNPEAPLIQNINELSDNGESFDETLGRNAGAMFSDKNGVVQNVNKKSITIKSEDGELIKKPLYHNFPFNRKTSLHNTPIVRKGDVVKSGDLLAKSNYTDDRGTLALGLNARVGLLPYKGHSMEDAIVVSEDFAKRLTSEHMYADDLEYKRGVKGGKNHYVSLFPKKFVISQLDKLDDNGVVLPGQTLEPGDPVALASKPRVVSSSSQKLGKLSSYMKNARNDASLVWEHETPGVVTDVVRTRSGVKVTVRSDEPAMPGDKVVFRSGQKGTISKIIPNDHMPRTVIGKPLELLLNPLGIPSRVNNSMIYELLLGKAAKATGKPYKLNAFTQPGNKWFSYVKGELDKHGISDVEEIFDPQSDKKLQKPATVGDAYVLKLHHTATKGFSARNQGAYDINEQPLKGGDELAQSKRLSGLETHGLLSSGAYGMLKDMSLLRGAKNDDYWQQLRSGYDPKMPDTPLVYNKFKTLLQGSGYHARQINKKGDMRLGPMTEKVLTELDPVEVNNPGLLEMRQLSKGAVVPVKGGLFDDSLSNTNKYGFVRLPFEVPNPAFEEPVRKILGLTEKQYRNILSGKEELPQSLIDRIAKFVKKSSTEADVYVTSAIPGGSTDLVNKHGLLSSKSLLDNKEVLKAVLANRAGTDWEESEEDFKARVSEELKDEFWGTSLQGPSVLFGDPDSSKITDAHPIKKLKSELIRINLSKLLKDHPGTRIVGSELVPYDPEGPEHQGDERHKDIGIEDVRKYISKTPEELWKHYDEPDGARYASNVPHAQIITPSGGIPPEYIDKAASTADVSQMKHTGPDSLAAALRTFSVNDVEKMSKEGLDSKKKSARGPSIKLMRYAHGMRKNNIAPSDYLITRVPVIPPKFRPFNIIGDSFVPGDANELYKDLFEVRDSYRDLRDELGDEAVGDSRLNVYDAVKAVYGFGDPVQPKTKSRGVSGFLKKLVGNQAKFSFFQRRLISKPVDSSGRGVIGVDPELDLDEIGIPKEMAWKLYAPYIQRRLVRSGRSAADAVIAIRDRAPHAEHAMKLESKDRPVIYSRSPAWHKYNITAGYPKLIEGNTIMISPLVTTGHNADFDGDAMNIQLPALPEAVDDAKNKLLPSKMLFSIKKRNDIVPKPKHEFILGLYSSQKSKGGTPFTFRSKADALKAIRAGHINLNDEVNIV